MHFATTASGQATFWAFDFESCHDMTFSFCTFYGDATGTYRTGDPVADQSCGLLLLADCDDIVVEDCTFYKGWHGTREERSRNITYQFCEFYNLQGDGIQLFQANDVTILNCYMHDWYGSDFAENHDDFVQLYTGATGVKYGKAAVLSTNIVVKNNVLLHNNQTDTTGVQGIFLNGEGLATFGYMTGIEVSNNLVMNSSTNAVLIDGAVDPIMNKNATIWSDNPWFDNEGNNTLNNKPRAQTRDSIGTQTIQNNLGDPRENTTRIATNGNIELDYNDPNDTYYAYDQFVNLVDGSEHLSVLGDLLLASGANAVGAGPDFIQPGASAHSYGPRTGATNGTMTMVAP